MLLELRYIRETEEGVMFAYEKGETVWLPKSQIELHDDKNRIFAELSYNETCKVNVPEWLIEENGLDFQIVGEVE